MVKVPKKEYLLMKMGARFGGDQVVNIQKHIRIVLKDTQRSPSLRCKAHLAFATKPNRGPKMPKELSNPSRSDSTEKLPTLKNKNFV